MQVEHIESKCPERPYIQYGQNQLRTTAVCGLLEYTELRSTWKSKNG